MKHLSVILGSLFGSMLALTSPLGVVHAEQSDAMAKALFSGVQGVPTDMQMRIAEQLAQKGFILQAGKPATESCGAVAVKHEVKDLNGDGKPEVLTLIGNACTSGAIGTSLYLFTQEADGQIQRHFGFSATGYDLIPTKNDPWPAILVRGTGDCLPVWRYKQGRYGFNNLYEAKKGACYVPQSDNVGG